MMIREATRQDFSQIAALIVAQSSRAERRCIHSDPRGGVEQALRELEQLEASGELRFVVCEGAMYGCAGAEFDRGLRRAWLRGPFAEIEQAEEWAQVAGRLVEAIEQQLPAEITILDSFLDTAHGWGGRLMEASGYRRVRMVHVYQADEAAPSNEGMAGCVEVPPEQAGAVAALHEQLFPNTYLTAEQILSRAQQPDSQAKIFVYLEEGQVLGYVYGSENLDEGVVDFLGVAPEARRRGIGRALLSAIMQWIFLERGLEKASLTVHDELVNAQALYEQAGFRLLYSGVHRRKQR